MRKEVAFCLLVLLAGTSAKAQVQAPASAVERGAPSGPPRTSTVVPTVAAPNAVIAVSGYALGLDDSRSLQVLFRQGDLERNASIGSSGRIVSRDADNEFQYMDVVVPADSAQGRWELVINTNARRSIPVPIEITDAVELRPIGISPPTPHPAQIVLLTTNTSAHVGVNVHLTDAGGRQWRIPTGVSSLGISLLLPDEVADGNASIRVERSSNAAERLSAPFRFAITSGPLPLNPSAVALMTPVAPGQWTDLVKDYETEFEVRRADRVEVEFLQDDVTEISPGTGSDHVRVHVPARLKPGPVTVRTRTWIEQDASEWSVPTTFTLLGEPVPPTITAIEASDRPPKAP